MKQKSPIFMILGDMTVPIEEISSVRLEALLKQIKEELKSRKGEIEIVLKA